MLAMSLMSVVIIAFAAVFPSGYRLNLKNLNQAKATGFANAIVEQLSNLPTATLSSATQGAAAGARQDLTTAVLTSSPPLITLPTGLLASNPSSTPNVFWLYKVYITRNTFGNPFGATDSTATTSQALATQIEAYDVTVVIKWLESRRNGGPVTRTATVNSLINSVMSR